MMEYLLALGTYKRMELSQSLVRLSLDFITNHYIKVSQYQCLSRSTLNLIQTILMSYRILYQSTQTCPYLYICQNSLCKHFGFFQPLWLTIIVYSLLPIGTMFCNLVGLSAGIYKVPLLMAFLDYPTPKATVFSYPIVLGAALANFILLIPKRNPFRVGSLVDYNLVLILIPCVSIGTTYGVAVMSVVPELVQDILIMLMFLFFSYYFFKKWVSLSTTVHNDDRLIQMPKALPLQMSTPSKKSRNTDVGDFGLDDSEAAYCYRQQLNDLLIYESGYHWRDIFISFVIFTIFQVMSLIANRDIDVLQSQTAYIVYLCIFALISAGFIYFIYRFTCYRLSFYKKVKYVYDVNLNNPYKFTIVLLGGLVGGFLQGVIGIGSGDCMMAAMLFLNMNPRVVSATTGYQILFVGLSSTIVALIRNQIQLWQAGFFFSVCFFIGGGLTLIIYRYLQEKPNVNAVLMLIVAILSVINVVSIGPNMYVIIKYYQNPWYTGSSISCTG